VPVQQAHESSSLRLRRFNESENIDGGERGSSFQTSDKKRQDRLKPVSDVDDFKAAAITKSVHGFSRAGRRVAALWD
jgi:hypothetical protein